MESVQSEREHEVIQLVAYYLWEQRGCPIGTPEVDWFGAEEQLREQGQDASSKSALVALGESVGSALGKLAGLAASVG